MGDVKGYVNGAKYKKQRDWYSFDFSKFEPNIVPHKNKKKLLYCLLTGTILPMNPEVVQKHVDSKRVQEILKQKAELEQKHAAKVEKRKEIKKKLKEMKLPEKGAEGSSTPTKK